MSKIGDWVPLFLNPMIPKFLFFDSTSFFQLVLYKNDINYTIVTIVTIFKFVLLFHI